MKLYGKLLALLCCLAMLLSLALVGCAPNDLTIPDPTGTTETPESSESSESSGDNDKPKNQFTLFDESAPSYTFSYASNGDGTCYVSDIQTNILTKQDYTVTIPEKSPSGDTVTEVRLGTDGNALAPILPPRYLRKESYESLIATMEQNLEKAIADGTVPADQVADERHRFAQFNAFYYLIDYTDPNLVEAAKEHYLQTYPIVTAIDAMYVLDNGNMGTETLFRLQYVIQTYSDYDAEDYAKEIEEIAALAKGHTEATNWVENTLLPYVNHGSAHITSLVLPDTVTKIQNGDFYYCLNLQTIKLPQVETPCQVQNTILVSADGTTLLGSIISEGMIRSTYAKIPDGVTAIAESVFAFSSKWKFIVPTAVTDIGSFSGTVYYEGTEAEWASVQNNQACTVYTYSETPALGCWYYKNNSPYLWKESDLQT